MVDLIAQRGGLELIDDGIALEFADRLQSTVERVTHRLQIAQAEFTRAGEWFARCGGRDFGERVAEKFLTGLETQLVGATLAGNGALAEVVERRDGGECRWQTEHRG